MHKTCCISVPKILLFLGLPVLQSVCAIWYICNLRFRQWGCMKNLNIKFKAGPSKRGDQGFPVFLPLCVDQTFYHAAGILDIQGAD